jgi:hypothetical protein
MVSSSRELARIAAGEVVPRRRDRELAKAAQDVRDEVLMAVYELQGAKVVAETVMYSLVGLDEVREQLGRDNPVRQMVLADVFATAAAQEMAIQRRLYTGW